MLLKPHDLVLFQGDSITDCGRNRDHEGSPECVARAGRDLGRGYPMQIAAELGVDRPELHLGWRNFGISGNRIVDLAARAQEHIWNHRPQVLSLLVGVNDVWHHFSRNAGVDTPRFARTYRQLLEDTRSRLPDLRLVLCEPFVLPCGVVKDGWRAATDEKRAVVTALAQEFGAVLVPFQRAFDEAVARTWPGHWGADGVHPSPAGHLLMARTWLAAVGAG